MQAHATLAPRFCHLHLHSQYSLLEGAIRLDELIPAIKAAGMDSVALTDNGNMFGAIHFYRAARAAGIHPVLGCQINLTSKSRHDRQVRETAHLVLLAETDKGYKNLSYLVSMGYLEGFYYKPRIDVELLAAHREGIICLSGGRGGVLHRAWSKGGLEFARSSAEQLLALFGPEHFFLELAPVGEPDTTPFLNDLKTIGKSLGIQTVASSDAHFLSQKDAEAHEILLCIGQGRSLTEFRESSQHDPERFVRTPTQMAEGHAAWDEDSRLNSVKIAERCQVELNLSETFLPNYEVPEGHTRESYLKLLAHRGLTERIEESFEEIDEEVYKKRLDYELDVITSMGFAGYFLVVWDFIRFAKESHIPVGPGRGSGAGSLVAFCLRITNLDPIPFDLLFERFLNPERVSMPDFDIDFCQDRRGEVITYVGEKYGANNVGQIVTYSLLSAKSVIKDVGRVLQLPFGEVNALTKLIPSLVAGKKVTIDQALDIEPKLREVQQTQPVFGKVIDIARSLEGLGRQIGMHAAGIVIGDKPLWDYVPVCRGKEGELITQFAKDEVELAGLVKFDFLGLKTLTVVARAEALVRQSPGQGPLGLNAHFDAEKIPLNDPKVYALLSRGDTDGVFQLESTGFKELLKRLRPDRFEDVVAAVALYRPGPLDAGMVDDYVARKHGRKKVVYPHPVCADILDTTYGVIVYQEQVMRIAVALSGFSMAEADILRKAMGKKKADVMAQMREKFVAGAHTHSSMAPIEATELFTQIEKFAGYAFNKSHSAAYAVISYQTAYLKTYYPTEFMAALLSYEMRDQDNVVRYITSAKEHGLSVLPPCVNRSERDFSVERDPANKTQAIRFGLGAVRGIGDGAIEAILDGRRHAHALQPKAIDALSEASEDPSSSGASQTSSFGCLFDFLEHVDVKKVNRRVVEALIKSGACDNFERPRAQLFAAVDRALDGGARAFRDRALGQANLFAALSPSAKGRALSQQAYPDVPEWPDKERLAWEKEALGFYITGHPLDHYLKDLPRLTTASTATLGGLARGGQRFGQEVTLGGVVSALRERPLKNGQGRMAFVTLEDLLGSCEVLVFSQVFAACETALKSQEPILVTGHAMIDGDDEEQREVKLRATHIALLGDERMRRAKNLALRLPLTRVDTALLKALRDAFSSHKGDVPVTLTLASPSQFDAELSCSQSLSVSPSDALMAKLENLVGRGAIVLQ